MGAYGGQPVAVTHNRGVVGIEARDQTAREFGRPAALAFIFVTVLLDVVALGVIIPVLPRLVESFLHGNTGRAAEIYGAAVAMAPEAKGDHESTLGQTRRLMDKLQPDAVQRGKVEAVFSPA